jgi:multidrug resistance efflux pump
VSTPRRAVRERPLAVLPALEEQRIPAWRLTRHVVVFSLGLFGTVFIGLGIAAAFVTMRMTVDGDGLLEPAHLWTARAKEGGIVARVRVQTGDLVRTGDVLVRLDSLAASTAVSEIDAQIAAAHNEVQRLLESMPVDSARALAFEQEAAAHVSRARTAVRAVMAEFNLSGDVDSIARLAGQRTHVGLDGPSADLMAAQAELRSAEAQGAAGRLTALDVAHKRLELRRLLNTRAAGVERLERLSVRAPGTGIVLTDQLEQLVNTAVVPGQSIIEIGDLTEWRAILGVSEHDIYRIHVGDSANLQLPAFAALPVDRLRGHVATISWQPSEGSVASPSKPNGNYRVIVSIDSTDVAHALRGALRRGYAVRGKIVTRSTSLLMHVVEYVRDRVRAIH